MLNRNIIFRPLFLSIGLYSTPCPPLFGRKRVIRRFRFFNVYIPSARHIRLQCPLPTLTGGGFFCSICYIVPNNQPINHPTLYTPSILFDARIDLRLVCHFSSFCHLFTSCFYFFLYFFLPMLDIVYFLVHPSPSRRFFFFSLRLYCCNIFSGVYLHNCFSPFFFFPSFSFPCIFSFLCRLFIVHPRPCQLFDLFFFVLAFIFLAYPTFSASRRWGGGGGEDILSLYIHTHAAHMMAAHNEPQLSLFVHVEI